MKDVKGVSLVALVITITVLIILSAVLVGTGSVGLDKVKEGKSSVEIRAIKDGINNRFRQYLTNETLYPLVGKEIDLAEANEAFGYDTTEELQYIRMMDSLHLSTIGVKKVKPEHIYIVNYSTSEVVGPIEE